MGYSSIQNILLAAFCAVTSATATVAADYSKGIIIVNENQYGKSGSTLNHLTPGNADAPWEYRVFRRANPGRELGGTSCFGTYHDGRLYVVSKFAKDPSGTTSGGILTVMDATTLEWVGQIDELDPSGARVCGRAFLGVDATKGYVSSSNGIWHIDLQTLKVVGQIPGTENPFGSDNKPVGDPTSSLYFGQCGMMVMAEGKVFAAHQSKGLLVIDPVNNRLLQTIAMDFVSPDAVIGSVVKAKDGSLWLSVTEYDKDYDSYFPVNKLVEVNPVTLATSVVTLPDGCFGPSTSWEAWRADTFCASRVNNLLFWTGGANSWYANQLVFKYDIASGKASCIIDFGYDDDLWKVSCPSMRVNPDGGELYMTLFKDVVSTEYMVRCYDESGNALHDYPMERAYWFPGVMLFPESDIAGIEPVVVVGADSGMLKASYSHGMLEVVADSDSFNAKRAVVYDLSGRVFASFIVAGGRMSYPVNLDRGIYLLGVGPRVVKFVVGHSL